MNLWLVLLLSVGWPKVCRSIRKKFPKRP